MADTKLRQACCFALSKLPMVTSPTIVVTLLNNELKSKNWHIREDVTNFIIYCLLKYNTASFNYHALFATFVDGAGDIRNKVKNSALEALVVLRHRQGTEIFQAQLNAAKAALHPDTFRQICERLAQQKMCILDNSMEGYVIYPSKQQIVEIAPVPTLIVTQEPAPEEDEPAQQEETPQIVPRRAKSAKDKIPWQVPAPKAAPSALKTSRIQSAPRRIESTRTCMNCICYSLFYSSCKFG